MVANAIVSGRSRQKTKAIARVRRIFRATRVSRSPIGYRRTTPAFTLLGPVLAGLGRVEVRPAFADGRHGLGDLGVEGVNFFRLGRARDRRTSVT